MKHHLPSPEYHASYSLVQSKSRTGEIAGWKARRIGCKLQEYVFRENFCSGVSWEGATSIETKWLGRYFSTLLWLLSLIAAQPGQGMAAWKEMSCLALSPQGASCPAVTVIQRTELWFHCKTKQGKALLHCKARQGVVSDDCNLCGYSAPWPAGLGEASKGVR